MFGPRRRCPPILRACPKRADDRVRCYYTVWKPVNEIIRMGTHYDSDMTDAQWALVAPLIPPARPGGRPRTADMRAVVNAICYLVRTGCQWRYLPHDLPPRGTVNEYFRRFQRDGTWRKIHDALRKQVRLDAGRYVGPKAVIIDSQTVHTTEKGGRAATTRRSMSPGASGR